MPAPPPWLRQCCSHTTQVVDPLASNEHFGNANGNLLDRNGNKVRRTAKAPKLQASAHILPFDSVVRALTRTIIREEDTRKLTNGISR